MTVVPQIAAAEIADICSGKIGMDEALLTGDKEALALAVRQLASAAEDPPPPLHPEKDLKVNQFELVQGIRERQRLIQVRRYTHPEIEHLNGMHRMHPLDCHAMGARKACLLFLLSWECGCCVHIMSTDGTTQSMEFVVSDALDPNMLS